MRASISKLTSFLQNFFGLVGRKAAFCLGLGVVAGLILFAVEAQFAVFIQIFLKAIGVSTEGITGKLNFIGDDHSISSLMSIMISIGVLRALVQFTISQTASIALESMNARLRLISLSDVLLRDRARYVSGVEVNNYFGEVFPKTALCVYYFALSLPHCVVAIAVSILLFSTSPQSAAIALPGLAVVGLIVLLLNRKIKRFASMVPLEQKELLHGVERVTRNWMMVRVFRTQNREFDYLSKKVTNYAGNSVKALGLSNLGSAVPQALGSILLVAVIFLDTAVFRTPGITIVSFLYLFLRLIQTLATLGNYLGAVAIYLPQARTTFEYFSRIMEDSLNFKGEANQNRIVARSNGDNIQSRFQVIPPPEVKISDVGFRYNSLSPWIFRDLKLTIGPGEQLGLVGPSGAGKSTLLAMLLGIHDPELGSIRFNNLSPREFVERYSNHIGFVSADPFLISGSIKDNLDYGSRKSYSEHEYKQALTDVCLTEFDDIKAMNISLSENGEGLSAGQKQRLSIARTLLRKPKFLILDEFTANLDAKTEAEIVSVVAKLKGEATTVIVSHRPSALKFSDRIIELGQK